MPLIEAFYMRVPVVAYAATAVPSTMDGAGVLYEDRDPVHVAGARRRGASDGALAERIVRGQDAALDRLRGEGLRRHAAAVRRPGPARPRAARPPAVAFDFWDQFHALRAAQGTAAVPAGHLPGPAGDGRDGTRSRSSE